MKIYGIIPAVSRLAQPISINNTVNNFINFKAMSKPDEFAPVFNRDEVNDKRIEKNRKNSRQSRFILRKNYAKSG